MDKTLADLRKKMDKATQEVVAALNKRAEVARQIGKAKQSKNIYVPEREAQVLRQALKINRGPLDDASLAIIMKEVIGACRNLEQRLRVAYLGPRGTYSEEAAAQFAGSTSDFVPEKSIDAVLADIARDKADIAVVPVENSTEGAVNRTLDLLPQSNLKIVGEIELPVHHQLLGKKQKISDVQEVIAHPQALAQCRQWLEANTPNARLVPESSNAAAAKLAATTPNSAAIAGKLAASIYGLQVLSPNIEDSPDNTTRFLALGKNPASPTGNDKTSLVCSAPNRSGSLYDLIGVFAKAGINMTKLESRPSASGLWDYLFYIDIDGHESEPYISEALLQAREHTTLVKVLGSYPKAAA